MPSKTSSRKTRKPAAATRGTRNARSGRKQRHSTAHAASRRTDGKGRSATRWSHHVMETSDAMDLEHDIFKSGTPDEIAASLKKSSNASRRRKGTPFQSAMSMLNFYINRAGRNLPKTRRAELDKAKDKLREAFGRPPSRPRAKPRAKPQAKAAAH
ncbi:DUF3175 domain-containing protein [Pigmentiphaga litoralis]|uniref:DUF3175 domain-containing protein n=1 Tax=Pigmentiphaga litoralis TaxID=516702 RepID=UPI0016756975|nr:DUF3175 domain-containing protein [Pigmentiphaga litoralis]